MLPAKVPTHYQFNKGSKKALFTHAGPLNSRTPFLFSTKKEFIATAGAVKKVHFDAERWIIEWIISILSASNGHDIIHPRWQKKNYRCTLRS
jgi:hypothetical protein